MVGGWGETARCMHDTRGTHEKRRRRVCSSAPWNAEVWPSVRLDGTSGSASSAGTVGVEAGQGFVAEFVEISAVNRRANIVQQLHEEMLVVDRGQRKPVELAGAQQVVDVRARIMLACVAVASLLQRPEIELMLGALDVVPAGARVDRAVAGAARGGHAVEGVAAVLHAREDIVHGGDAQHMARAVLRHRVADPRAGVSNDALLDRAADSHAVEVQRGDLRGRAPA